MLYAHLGSVYCDPCDKASTFYEITSQVQYLAFKLWNVATV